MIHGFIKVAAASPVVHVANPKANADEIISLIKTAHSSGVSLIVFPELSLTGYTCGDLFLHDTLINSSLDALSSIMESTSELDIVSIVGLPVFHNSRLYNCAAVVFKGKILGIIPKRNLPNYSEFYEQRHFSVPDDRIESITVFGCDVPFGRDIVFAHNKISDFKFGVELCEDLWVSSPPSSELAALGAVIIANLSAGNEVIGKADYRRSLVCGQSARTMTGYIYANAGMGESTTDLVFSGHSIISENGRILGEIKPFSNEHITITEIDVNRLASERRKTTTYLSVPGARVVLFDTAVKETVITRHFDRNPFVPKGADMAARSGDILNMQAYGLKKRLEHIHSKAAVLGVSGGLDSTLALIVCVMAAELMGMPRSYVHALTLPCFGTTKRTRSNAEKLCRLLGVTFEEIDIKAMVNQHMSDIGHDESNHNVVYENAQARVRTLVLMNYANKVGGIVIGTGDMSELALGWATYNGDHMSMYGVNASIPKTLIRHLVSYYSTLCDNDEIASVLNDILDTPISPELLPSNEDGAISQKTEELVGPYELHDFFLYYFIRFGFSPKKIFRLAAIAYDGVYDNRVILHWLNVFFNRFFAQQFKRSCLPDGAKVGTVSLSPRGDFRMPSDAERRAWISEIDELISIYGE